MELVLIRHGRPERVDNDPGGADPELTELGHRQAKAAAVYLSSEPITRIYASPQRRAQQTADPIADSFGVPLETIDGLAEYDYGHPSYIPAEEYGRLSADELQELVDHLIAEPFTRRVLDSFEHIVASNPGRSVAAVCHGGVISTILAHVLGTDPTRYYDTDYTSITRVKAARDGRRSLASFNECHWLRDLR